MSSPYHEGERAVQARAGVQALAERVGGSIRSAMPEVGRRFVGEARLVVIGALDAAGRPWASIVAGPRGLATAVDDRTIRIERAVAAGDPLAERLEPGAAVGLLVPDLAARRRMRINGHIVARDGGAILVRSDQVYANCPQYIQPRTPAAEQRLARDEAVVAVPALSGADREWVRRADTFFITTAHPTSGVDTSHRGGPPGFIEVEDDLLRWPDYAGNAMFNTLGNIAAYPRAGIAIPDFETGRVLQVSGTAAIEWGAEGVMRAVSLRVEEIRVREGGVRGHERR